MIRIGICLFALLLAAPVLAKNSVPGGHEANAVAYVSPTVIVDSTVVIAMFGFLGLACTVGGPILLVTLQSRQRRAEKAEDYARQDLVAARVDAAARQAKESAQLVVGATERAAKTQAIGQARLDGQFNQIHALVNSGYTTQLQATLTATEAQLVSMRRDIDGRKDAGREPSPDEVAALVALEKSIADQKAALDERRKATDTAAKEKAEQDQKINMATGEVNSETKVAADVAATVVADALSADKMTVAAETMSRAADKAEITADKLTRN